MIMRVAYVLPSLINKGPVIVAHTLVKHLLPRLEQVDVYYFDELPGAMKFPCPTHRITMGQPFDFGRYDIIHSHMYRPDHYLCKWRKQIHACGAKTVTTIHQNIYDNFRYSHGPLVGWTLTQVWLPYIRAIDAAVPISEALSRHYRTRLPNLTPVIYNGVDVDYAPMQGDPEIRKQIQNMRTEGCVLLGSYAAVTRRKGLDQVIALLGRRADLRLVLIGEGREVERLKQQAARLAVADRVLFLPYQRAPYNYLDLIDVYVMPSRAEGFGLSHVEAACTRTPVVCSDIPVFRELFTEQDVAFFTLEDLSSLSAAVDACVEHGESYSEHAYRTVVSRFSGAVMGEAYWNLYVRLCAAGKNSIVTNN